MPLIALQHSDAAGATRKNGQEPIMDKTDKKVHINFWYIIAAVLGMMLIQDLYLESTKLTPIPYSRFQTLLTKTRSPRSG
jgi:cell division protease FtsH